MGCRTGMERGGEGCLVSGSGRGRNGVSIDQGGPGMSAGRGGPVLACRGRHEENWGGAGLSMGAGLGGPGLSRRAREELAWKVGEDSARDDKSQEAEGVGADCRQGGPVLACREGHGTAWRVEMDGGEVARRGSSTGWTWVGRACRGEAGMVGNRNVGAG